MLRPRRPLETVPFFSIMQAPVVPSVIRLTASGDLSLLEENLVIDVKSGWFIDTKSTGKLPTYYYGENRNLSTDLGRCSDLRRLYGIRRGVGVVAEDEKEKTIHIAVYVPWRRWGSSGPLLYLKSTKLPFLIYARWRNFELYRGELQNNTLSEELSVLLLSKESLWTNSSK